MRIERVPHRLRDRQYPSTQVIQGQAHLDTLIVQLEAVLNTAHEDFADLEAVAALLGAALQPALLVRDVTVNDTVTNRLADDILCVFFRVKMELDADIPERDARV